MRSENRRDRHVTDLTRATTVRWKGRPATLYLARHGRSTWNEQSRVAGQLDPELSDLGRHQAESLGELLSGVGVEAIHCSPLLRARQTAAPIATRLGLVPHVHDELRELHFGDLQGRFRDRRDPEALRMLGEWKTNMLSARLPGGESLEELHRRVARFLLEILDGTGPETILVVGHRYTNRVLFGTLLGLRPPDWLRLRQKCRDLLIIERDALPRIRTFLLDGNWPSREGVA